MSWDAPPRATHYDVTYSGGGVNAWAAWNRAGTNLTITCDNRYPGHNLSCVSAGTTYTVGVRARNAAGESAWMHSSPASLSAPDPVTNIQVTHNRTSLSVSWDAPAGAAYYDVTYTDANNISWVRVAWGRAGVSITISNGVYGNNAINGGTTYIVGVRAKTPPARARGSTRPRRPIRKAADARAGSRLRRQPAPNVHCAARRTHCRRAAGF